MLTAHHLGELADRAELLTSELTTNAVRYSKGPAAVLLRWAAPILRVSVSDPCPEFPAPRVPVGPVAADAERGRGLLILDLLADAWGDCCAEEPALGSVGKSIWFELILGAGPPSPEAPRSRPDRRSPGRSDRRTGSAVVAGSVRPGEVAGPRGRLGLVWRLASPRGTAVVSLRRPVPASGAKPPLPGCRGRREARGSLRLFGGVVERTWSALRECDGRVKPVRPLVSTLVCLYTPV
ncbi:ATP-binding protein [Streptomyces sp. F63]|uniref:ATP-binding protein n=1 Tax=Streptomyces sp. F63 TaxID=2824887 RepID=UPI001B384BBE|nr:ATP-binding protein [Streptomyces sp. F63]MBQ0984539.1 ATP-binding protein [Streptomyces sp. F63]